MGAEPMGEGARAALQLRTVDDANRFEAASLRPRKDCVSAQGSLWSWLRLGWGLELPWPAAIYAAIQRIA